MDLRIAPWLRGIAATALVVALLGSCATSTTLPGAPPIASQPSPTPSEASAGHEEAEAPTDPTVSLPSYGYYASLRDPGIRAVPFSLTDQTGAPYRFDPAGDDAAITLLYFGYTNCPDLCPSELATVATALRDLPGRIADEVQMVFVSVDPARDDVARMAAYVPMFDPDFIGLTGDEQVIERAQTSHGIPAAERVGQGEGYAMRHAAEVFAFTDDGRAHLAFPFGMTVLQWEHDLWKLVQSGWRQPR